MKKEHIHELILSITESDIPPQSIHLWPDIRTRLATMNIKEIKQGEKPMKTQKRFRPGMVWGLASGAALLAMGLFFIVSPQGKALAQEILNFFKRNDANLISIPMIDAESSFQPDNIEAEPVIALAGPAEACGNLPKSTCSLAMLKNVLSFSVREPKNLPQGMSFYGAAAVEGGIMLEFRGELGTLLLVESEVIENPATLRQIGNDAIVTSTYVNDQPAEFVEGGWIGAVSDHNTIPWDSSLPNRILRWQADGIDFSLIHYPAGGTEGPIGFEIDQLIAIAETMQENPEVASNAVVAGLTLDEAETRAGFNFLESGWLPGGLLLTKTTFDSAHNSICQYYGGLYDNPENPVLVIVQSNWTFPAFDEIQSKLYWGDQLVEIAKIQEDITIPGANNDSGTYYQSGLQVDAICGGTPTNSNQLVVWQKGSRVFALFARLDSFQGISFVTRMDMQRIAASINGAPSPTSTADPERWTSLKDAQTIMPWKIEEPGIMLNTLHFSHIHTDSTANGERAITVFSGTKSLANGIERLILFQESGLASTLDDYKTAGGYADVTLLDQPAIMNINCSENDLSGRMCYHEITWKKGNLTFSLIGFFDSILPKEKLLEIAESIH